MRLGLVLGAGGTVGYGWHTGVLAALAEVAGIDPREAGAMVGTSAGSYAVAYLRAGFSGSDMFAVAVGDEPSAAAAPLLAKAGPTRPLASWDRPPLRSASAGGLVRSAWTSRSLPRTGAVLAALLPAGTVSGEPFLTPLRRLYAGGQWPAGVRIPAVRLRDGRRVVFDAESGVPLADAVAASSAIPGYMAPVELGGERYVDGSVHAPTNADLLAGEALDVVIVSAPMAPPAAGTRLTRDLPLRAWAGRHLAREVAALARGGARVITIAPSAAARASMAGSGMAEVLRAPAARAGYAQVLAAGPALLRQIS